MRKNLIFSSVGDQSRYPAFWLSHKGKRTFDIVCVYYGNKNKAYESEFWIEHKGGKFQNLHWLYHINKELFQNYEYIFVLDDDIQINTLQINAMFEIANKYDLWMCAPSFSSKSIISHAVTQCHPGNVLRYTNFVEVNTPFFKSSKLLNILERKDYPTELVGWGLDYYFAWVMGDNIQNRYAIVDEVQCINPQSAIGVREIDRLERATLRRCKWESVKMRLNIPEVIGKTYRAVEF